MPSTFLPTPPSEPVTEVSNLAADNVKQNIAENAAPGSTKAPLDASKMTVTFNTNGKEVPALDDPTRYTTNSHTDHMITAVWKASTGWEAPELRPYGPLSIMPNASVLHYATECFEGLKAYRGYDGKIRLFRPDCNCRRMVTSATRISLPAFDTAALESMIFSLVGVDGPKFLPESQPGNFLYIRPTLIGTHSGLGVQAPAEATLFIILTYMPTMSEPENGLRLLASQEDSIRAWPGGFGYAKVGSNYGPTLSPSAEAKALGYDQILWLFGPERFVTESGASNFCIVWKTREGKLQLVTAPLGDKIILDGVTRRSVLQLVRERLSADNKYLLEPIEVVERKYTMVEVEEAANEGRIVEAFACGTAYFVCPVSAISFRGKDLKMPMTRGDSGEYAYLIKTWLKNIMYGKESHEWAPVVDEKKN